MNRFCVFFKGHGYLPLNDAPLEFLTSPPRKIGDDVLVRANGKTFVVRLLRSSGHVKNGRYLVAWRSGW